MKALCITGADFDVLETVASPFYQSGLMPAKPLDRETTVDFKTWHRAVGQVSDPSKIGRLWCSLAEDLILANYDSECWGWHDPLSVRFLDFWAELDPNINFMLVCVKPEQAIISNSELDVSNNLVRDTLNDWYLKHNAMLQFYLKNPERSVLVDADTALAHISDQIELAREEWKLPITADHSSTGHGTPEKTSSVNSSDRLMAILGRELLADSDLDIVGLYRELTSAQYSFGEKADLNSSYLVDWFNQDIPPSDLNSIFSELFRLKSKEIEVDSLRLELDTNTKKLLIEKDSETVQLENQLNAVQEELENLHSMKTPLEEELSKAKYTIEQLNFELIESEANLKNTSTVIEEGNQLLGAQLTQVQEELENLQSMKTRLEEELSKAKDTIEQLNSELIESEANLKNTSTVIEEDNQLLEAQLTQVQEELELYFHKYQELAVKKSDEQNTAIPTLTNPVVYCIEEPSLLKPKLNWSMKNVVLDDESIDSLEVVTSINRGRLEVSIKKGAVGSVFKYSSKDNSSNLTFFIKDHDFLQLLHPKDYRVLASLIVLIRSEIASSKLSIKQSNRWAKVLDSSCRFLSDSFDRLSFSSVKLRNEQVNRDYEHLWVVLNNVSFGSKKIEQWSFRLSCAGIVGLKFGDQPKIEIPEQRTQLISSWYAESEDDHGAKYELRFAKPNSMDVNVWSKIDLEDKKILVSLIKLLPSILIDLKIQGRYISRDWSDWLSLSGDVNRIVMTKLR